MTTIDTSRAAQIKQEIDLLIGKRRAQHTKHMKQLQEIFDGTYQALDKYVICAGLMIEVEFEPKHGRLAFKDVRRPGPFYQSIEDFYYDALS